MEKICTNCGKKERVHYRTICNECLKEQKKMGYHKRRMSYQKEHYVYLLENENYVGTTNSIHHRFKNHQSNNKDVTKYRILYKSKNRNECLELEELLHDLGYEGRHSQNSYK